jgi:hypothetical protein
MTAECHFHRFSARHPEDEADPEPASLIRSKEKEMIQGISKVGQARVNKVNRRAAPLEGPTANVRNAHVRQPCMSIRPAPRTWSQEMACDIARGHAPASMRYTAANAQARIFDDARSFGLRSEPAPFNRTIPHFLRDGLHSAEDSNGRETGLRGTWNRAASSVWSEQFESRFRSTTVHRNRLKRTVNQ